jgi:predicted TIM-barrel fold metal-dependent hydrolase
MTRLICCDAHMDLGQLPADIWSSRLPAEFHNRAPRVEERDGRMAWVCDGKVWGRWEGRAPDPTAPKTPLQIITAFDRGNTVNAGVQRPANAKLRLEDMDRDGVYAQVIFGPIFPITTDDDAFRAAVYAVYNDWLAEFCSAAPDRLIGVAMLPEIPEPALAELKRVVAKKCFRQVNVQIALAKPAISDARWEPFWTELEATGMLLSFHVTVFMPPAGDPATGKPAGAYASTKGFIDQFLPPFVDLFAWGILERHPKMKIVLAESGLGWLPWIIQDLDYRHWRLWELKEWWDERGGIPLKTKPSDLFKRHIFTTFQEDPVAMHLLDFYNQDNLLWASDYPHPDSIWPNSIPTIEKQMAHLSPEMRKKLTHDNAVKLYGLKVEESAKAAE